MKFGSTLGRATALAALIGLLSLQSGCGSAHDVTASVNQKISEGKFLEAQEEGASFLKYNEDESGQLAWALARASAQLGDHDQAIQYAGVAVKANAVSKVQLMSEPMLEPVRTDIRYISVTTGSR